MKIGIISDTHNYLDPRVSQIFAGVDHILHAGDVGLWPIITGLEQIAPVTAVAGNTDEGLPLRETELVTLAGKKFLVHHIVTPGLGSPRIDQRLRDDAPDVIIFGHTHKPFAQQVGGTLYLNPGSAGQKRFDLPRTVVLMKIASGKFSYRFIPLE